MNTTDMGETDDWQTTIETNALRVGQPGGMWKINRETSFVMGGRRKFLRT